ncbi:class I adenylate-forming enzyme family protein [Lysinibacillus parviboronicapiens]|uniref:class I adenylate-forming enzyme family protein n=1 Tax=Lysinibacillus parviboronicapiens TaxID=436516 RepID=UPI000AB07CAB|nr:long-chain fatty acid--CoA ligase [Lysinibacillus parviboronicapiens]
MTMLMTDILQNYAEQQPEAIATMYGSDNVTYGEFYKRASKFAAYLQAQGYEKDDVIALYTLNSDLFLIAYIGVQIAGFVVMPINTKLATPEVEFIFNHSQVKGLIYDERIEDTIAEIPYAFQHVIGLKDMAEIIQSFEGQSKTVLLEANDTAVVMYTSGTTGKPKGVMLTHQNIVATADIWSTSMNMKKQDNMFICTPLFHCAGLHVFAMPMFYKGGTVIIEEGFSPTNTLVQLADSQATIFFGVPSMYTIILNTPAFKEHTFKNLRLLCYGAAPMPYELVKQVKEAFPQVKVQNLYGQTENSPAATSLLDADALTKIGSVGQPLAQTEVRVVDSYGESVPAGEVGEICVKGPQVMKGYLRNDEETARTIRDGWLYSGDLGRFDEEGYLYIVDRKKDMIIRGGENIYPIEVEEVLYQLPDILEAAVVGLPHEVYGEVPKAFVVLKEGKSLNEETILAYCRTQLAKYKMPHEIEFLVELPRNASGKVLKHTLRPTVKTT